jgi:hypothetical protein
MLSDNHGLAISTASPDAAAALNRTLAGFLKYRLDTPQHLKQVFIADPEFGFAHCLQGYFGMLGFKEALVPRAADAAGKARRFSAAATTREQAHGEALEAWIAGDLDRTLATWERILAQHPHDLLAFRLAHFNAFWLGRPQEMRASVDRIAPKWSPELPGYGTLLACRCFAYEETGDYSAEADGRKAVAIDPADLWATHAVAHVLEMQGRHGEGIAWLKGLEGHWGEANNVAHHLWWHWALFHMERREFAEVLELYDHRFRNLASPLTRQQPDLYIDVQNAASMLFRLARQGVAVGERWVELADLAEPRIGDHRSAFTLPHWMMALAAAGRHEAARRMLLAMEEFGRGGATLSPVVGRIALPVCEAVLAHGQGDYARAVTYMRPVLNRMYQLGGSHAQQDVLEQVFLDSALRADLADDVRRILARVASRHPVPPQRRVGYAEAAKRYLAA